jgi:hypothetical protein
VPNAHARDAPKRGGKSETKPGLPPRHRFRTPEDFNWLKPRKLRLVDETSRFAILSGEISTEH